jgi:hypothetical protein
MPNLARFAAETKPRLAAPRPNSAPWPLLRLLPARLAALPDDARAVLRTALDTGRARLVFDTVDGGVLVFPAGRA